MNNPGVNEYFEWRYMIEYYSVIIVALIVTVGVIIAVIQTIYEWLKNIKFYWKK